jgi:hypothetical protein
METLTDVLFQRYNLALPFYIAMASHSLSENVAGTSAAGRAPRADPDSRAEALQPLKEPLQEHSPVYVGYKM